MPKINIETMPWKGGTGYPEPFKKRVGDRTRKRLGDAGGLTQFGANLTRLGPGAQSSMRHWHEVEDEFVYILEGALILIDDDGRTPLNPGDAACFKANDGNGHHLVNESDAPAVYLEIGTRSQTERAHYPDDNLRAIKEGGDLEFTRKDGTLYGEDEA